MQDLVLRVQGFQCSGLGSFGVSPDFDDSWPEPLTT